MLTLVCLLALSNLSIIVALSASVCLYLLYLAVQVVVGLGETGNFTFSAIYNNISA